MGVRGYFDRWPLDDTLAVSLGQQRLYLAAELWIATAGFSKESPACGRFAVSRRVVQILDLLQALRRHSQLG
jgi:hypothetical protein